MLMGASAPAERQHDVKNAEEVSKRTRYGMG
jgi:hypothetical protein